MWILDKNGKFVRGGVVCDDQPEDRSGQICEHIGVAGTPLRTLPSGVEVWGAQGKEYLVARVGLVAVGYRTSPNFLARLTEIQKETQEYDKIKQNLRAVKSQMLLILVFFTMLLLFSVMWIALFLAKQVTVPIQALAEGTREVSSGNFDYQVPEQAQDELGILIRSFNTMVTQLRDSRAQIDQFTRNLQQAVQELERRRQLMETILENVPTGVVSLDADGGILRENTAVTRMFGEGSARRSVAGGTAGCGGGANGAVADAAVAADGRGIARNRDRGGGAGAAPGGYGELLGAAAGEHRLRAGAGRSDGDAARAEDRGVAGSGTTDRA